MTNNTAYETRKIIATFNGNQVIHAAQIINRTPGYDWPAATASPTVLRRLLDTYAARPVVRNAVNEVANA